MQDNASVSDGYGTNPSDGLRAKNVGLLNKYDKISARLTLNFGIPVLFPQKGICYNNQTQVCSILSGAETEPAAGDRRFSASPLSIQKGQKE